MKKLVISHFVLFTILVTSCGLFLGPLPEMSLQQKIIGPWEKIDLFHYSLTGITLINDTNTKLEFYTLKDNTLRGIMGVFYGGGLNQLYLEFNQNNQVNVITNIFSPAAHMNNAFNLYCDHNDYKLIYKIFGGQIEIYQNHSFNIKTHIGGIPNGFFYLTDFDNIMFSDNTSSQIYRDNINNMMTPGILFSAPSSTIAQLSLLPQTLIIRYCYFATNQFGSNYYQIIDLNSGTQLLDKMIYNTLMPTPKLNLFSYQDKLFYLNNNQLMRYNPGGKQFVVEKDYENKLIITPQSRVGGLITTDNKIFFYIIPPEYAPGNEKTRLYYYDIIKKISIIKDFPDITTTDIIGHKIYYDPNSKTVYFGVVKTNSTDMYGWAYKNQF